MFFLILFRLSFGIFFLHFCFRGWSCRFFRFNQKPMKMGRRDRSRKKKSTWNFVCRFLLVSHRFSLFGKRCGWQIVTDGDCVCLPLSCFKWHLMPLTWRMCFYPLSFHLYVLCAVYNMNLPQISGSRPLCSMALTWRFCTTRALLCRVRESGSRLNTLRCKLFSSKPVLKMHQIHIVPYCIPCCPLHTYLMRVGRQHRHSKIVYRKGELTLPDVRGWMCHHCVGFVQLSSEENHSCNK